MLESFHRPRFPPATVPKRNGSKAQSGRRHIVGTSSAHGMALPIKAV